MGVSNSPHIFLTLGEDMPYHSMKPKKKKKPKKRKR